MSRWFILAGLILIVTGILLYFIPGIFKWFGKLPGDIRIESERIRVYIPIVSMVLVSLVLTIIAYLFHFFKK